MDAWFEVSVTVQTALVDVVSGQLFDLGCGGIQEEATDAGVRLRAYFEGLQHKDRVRGAVQDLLQGQGEVFVVDVPDQDWTISWRTHFRPIFPTPRIAVCPPWDHPPVPEGGFVIEIDPKMAFGTGHHETTRLALVGLDRSVQAGHTVLDVGTGSGILSIAAIKLGAVSAVAVDTDAPAIENARENLVQNGVQDVVDVRLGSVDGVVGQFDVVVCNIISSILIPLLPALIAHTHPQGCLILGGVLIREKGVFMAALDAVGLVVHEVMEDGEWVCVQAKLDTKG